MDCSVAHRIHGTCSYSFDTLIIPQGYCRPGLATAWRAALRCRFFVEYYAARSKRLVKEARVSARTGAAFLRGLKDSRELWLGSERVDDATTHPALTGAAHAIAEVFDLQHTHADICLMPDPETGEAINVSHMIPRARRSGTPACVPRTHGRVFRRADGAHARLYERDLCGVRRTAR